MFDGGEEFRKKANAATVDAAAKQRQRVAIAWTTTARSAEMPDENRECIEYSAENPSRLDFKTTSAGQTYADTIGGGTAPRLRCSIGGNRVEAAMATAEKLAQVPQTRSSLLNVEEVAELLQVPVSWVYERTRRRGRDRLPGFHLGKYWRFDEAELRAWLECQRSGSDHA